MSYFPAFLKFDNKKILIIGGGYIAQEKLEHLLDFTNKITLISKDYTPSIQKLIDDNSLIFSTKEYKLDDIKGFDIIIAAVDNFDLQESIYKESRNYNCLCNCVDLPKYCDFIFPSYVKKGSLTIAVSTSGTSPAIAKHLRIWLNKLIPNSIVKFLEEMKDYRKTMPKGKERMHFLDEKAKKYIENWKDN
jgi:precorrin-2 dehydrogenase/sirohydrochlorin ferrochelatase